ncbi:MAG: PilT/PilU family type 4a pilus ATPase [Syntrophomonadaceae bacterium]|nr:PilT/PilU family type 4a pilus ATPase [Syntrophomonadaceae bacterium]
MYGKSALDIINEAVVMGASDLHLVASYPPICRVNGMLVEVPGAVPLSRQDARDFGEELLPNAAIKKIIEKYGQADFARSFQGLGRVRVNLYRQSGSWAAAVRIIPEEVPRLEALGLPVIITELAMHDQGLILITGATGSGKSTTLAAMLDFINKSQSRIIITLEDPIEFIHRPGLGIINQREVGRDIASFTLGLRAALRQDPDVIMVGEMRDLETISTAVTAAETGHLVLASLHSGNTIQTLERTINVFPPHQQSQIRTQLATTLLGIISQQLIPTINGNDRVAAAEVLILNSAIRNLIRENKMHQIYSAIQTGASTGMISMGRAVKMLYLQNLISYESFNKYAVDWF